MLEAGESVNYVAQVLGHSSPSFTLRVYGHVLPDRHVEAATRMDQQLRGPSSRQANAASPTGEHNGPRAG